MEHPTVELTNGLTVLNFSSPHAFNFEDGSILPACSPELSKIGNLATKELIVRETDKYKDIHIVWELTPQIVEVLSNLHTFTEIDIILVPLPVMVAIKESGIWDLPTHFPKVRVIRVVDRLTKAISIDTFCV